VVFLGYSAIATGQSVTLSLGVGRETADGSVVVPIHLASSGGAPIAATNADKSLVCNANACWIYGLNSTGIADGDVATVMLRISPVDAEAAIREADCVAVTDHKKVDYPELVKNARLIVDTRNALKGIQSERIVRL